MEVLDELEYISVTTGDVEQVSSRSFINNHVYIIGFIWLEKLKT